MIGYSRNMGKGYAVKTGFTHTRGDVVIFMDSDLEVDPGQMVCYLKALRHADLVVASKWHPRSRVEMPLIRKFLSRGFNALVKLLTGIRLSDTQTRLKKATGWRPKMNSKRALRKTLKNLGLKEG